MRACASCASMGLRARDPARRQLQALGAGGRSPVEAQKEGGGRGAGRGHGGRTAALRLQVVIGESATATRQDGPSPRPRRPSGFSFRVSTVLPHLVLLHQLIRCRTLTCELHSHTGPLTHIETSSGCRARSLRQRPVHTPTLEVSNFLILGRLQFRRLQKAKTFLRLYAFCALTIVRVRPLGCDVVLPASQTCNVWNPLTF